MKQIKSDEEVYPCLTSVLASRLSTLLSDSLILDASSVLFLNTVVKCLTTTAEYDNG